MKKELSQIWRELQTMKDEQHRHSKFLPKGDPEVFEEIEEKKKPENPILMFFKGILYVTVGLLVAWMLRR